MKSKKGIIITTIVVLLLLVVGVTYAFFTYESGTKSDIVTGQIYMNYEETSTISLTGVFPETKEQALSRNDENGVFEFSITGRNTSKYPVYYEIDLLEGGVMTGKTEQSTKILPEHVRIYLERDGEPLVDGMTYKDWNNRRIYVDTVPANQATNIEHKYTLRMWIDENVTISDTDPNADYTTTEWNDAYTSLKVRVVGDFEYKELATDASCFKYYITLTDLTLDTSEEKVEACIAFSESFLGPEEEGNTVDVGETYEAFCNGTGTNWGYTLKEVIAGGVFTDEEIQLLGVVESYEGEIEITDYNVSCGLDVIIPTYIKGLPVTRIADENYYIQSRGVFQYKYITSVKLPNTLKYIGEYAFSDNDITDVEIGTGIATIEKNAFRKNPLVNVNIKNNPILGAASFIRLGIIEGINFEFQIFKYGGTCEELNSYKNIFSHDNLPKTIVTTNNDACEYTGFVAE